MPLSFPYYYGHAGEQYAFFRIPKLLITDSRFDGVSSDAKLLPQKKRTPALRPRTAPRSAGLVRERLRNRLRRKLMPAPLSATA